MKHIEASWFVGVTALATFFVSSVCGAQVDENSLLKIGGFRCVDLKSLSNDNAYDLYQVGYFCYARKAWEGLPVRKGDHPEWLNGCAVQLRHR